MQGGTDAMGTLAIAYTLGEAGYCASLFSDTDSSACDQMEYCTYTGGSCDLIPNLETAVLGESCEAVSSSSTTVAAGLTGMLDTLGYTNFAEMEGTLVGGGGGGSAPIAPTGPGCYMDSTTPVSDCTCHSSCYNCGYYNMPTAADDCITCADPNVQVDAVYSDGTGYCSTSSTPTATPPPPPPPTWPDLSTFCNLYRSHQACHSQECPTSQPYECLSESGMCEMISENYDAWHGVHCSWNGTACYHYDSQHNEYCATRQGQDECYQNNNGLTGPLHMFLSGDSGCGSLDNETTCTANQNCTWYSSSSSSYSNCEPLIAAVNASMLSTGANAAITEYAIAEKQRYACKSLDESTCSSVDGCNYYGCMGTSPDNAASCGSRDGTTCEANNCVWDSGSGSGSGSCSGMGNCPTATSQHECEYELENNCHWDGCSSSHSYGVIQVATACAAEYSTTDLDYIAKGNGRNSWNEMVSGSSGSSGSSGPPPEDVDFCTAWMNVAACDVADGAGATSDNCPDFCTFDDSSTLPTCSPTSSSVSAWDFEKSTHVTGFLTACDSYGSDSGACGSDGDCFFNGVTCEPTYSAAMEAVFMQGGTDAMGTLAIAYTLGEAGYCASLFSDTDSSACDQMEYCTYTGGSCDLIPNLETAVLGESCEAVSSSSTTVAAGLTGMLDTLGYTNFAEMEGTLVGGGGGGSAPIAPTGPGCYMDSTTPVSDCTCHSSCYNCGYYNMPTAADDCITCADPNVQVDAVYSDGTGYCSTSSTPTATPPPPPPPTWPDLSTFCNLYRSHEACHSQECPTSQPYGCLSDQSGMCEMISANYDAWHGVHCSWNGTACYLIPSTTSTYQARFTRTTTV